VPAFFVRETDLTNNERMGNGGSART